MSRLLAFFVFVLYGCHPPGCSPDGSMRLATPAGSQCFSNASHTGICINGTDLYICTYENVGCDKYEAKCTLSSKLHVFSPTGIP